MPTNWVTGERHSDRDISLHADNGNPKGIWSDGATMWVSDWVADKVYSYNMPALDNTDLRKVVVEGTKASGSTLDGGWYATVESTATQVTVKATAAQLKAMASHGDSDSDAVADGHQLAIPDLTAKMTITVTVHNGDTRKHTLTVSRVNTGSARKVRLGGSVTGDVANPEDFDVVTVDLVTDELYRFDLEGIDNGDGALANPRLLGLFKLVYGTAVPVGDTEDFPGGYGTNSSEVYHEPKPEEQGQATKATYYIVVGSENGASGGYRLSVSYEDEASADTTTAAAEVLPSSKSSGKRGRYHFRGAIGEPGGVDWIDVDWIKVTLDAEQMYRIVLKSGATGSYDLLVMGVEDDCQPDNTSTHDSIDVGGSRNGRINYGGDTDWFRAELTGGTAYTATVTQGEGASPIPVPRVLIYDTAASMVAVGESASDMNSSVASYTRAFQFFV